MIHRRIREVRLKREYAELYPTLTPDVWAPAADAAAELQALLRGADPALEERLMNERHFEFRGGIAERRGIRSRLADRGGG